MNKFWNFGQNRTTLLITDLVELQDRELLAKSHETDILVQFISEWQQEEKLSSWSPRMFK